MTAEHAYMIVAATLATGIAATSGANWSPEKIYNQYVGLFTRVRMKGINPTGLDAGEKL